jgi:predicted DNA-binding mobile mystery protein A
MDKRVRERNTRRMDEAGLGLRVARYEARAVRGWLKEIRQAVGIPVDEVARRLGVGRWEVHRLEQAEIRWGIGLGTLKRAAEALDCDLVYGLVPREGTLKEMAARQKEAHDEALEAKREKERAKKEAERQAWLEAIGWREAMREAMRTALRRDGVRIRPRKTDRGMAESIERMKIVMKLAALPVTAEEVARMKGVKLESPGTASGGNEG